MSQAKRRVPAEWEPQSAVQLTWPHANTDWGADLQAVEIAFSRIAAEISLREKVLLVHSDTLAEADIQSIIEMAGGNIANLLFKTAASNDSWARDHAPISVFVDERKLLLDFEFNGWNGKYPARLDNQITRQLLATNTFNNAEFDSPGIELEGGALDFDGQGCLLTTRSCVLDARPDGGRGRTWWEEQFSTWFGVETTHWLRNGHIVGDDTDGHIDTLARFTDPGTIAYQGCDDPADEHYATLSAMAEELAQLRNRKGKTYQLVALPLPAPIRDESGKRLPATYANFLIINGAVLVPTYADPADAKALQLLQTCFPGRTIIGLDCRPLVRQGGSLHCVTMQYPAGIL